MARLSDVASNGWLATAIAAPLIGAAATLALVIPTLAPGVLSQAGGDTAEFQTVAWVLGTAHPTGYPSYIVLGFLFSHLFWFLAPAYSLNLMQAALAAGALAGTVAIVQLLTGARWIALATGLLLLIMPAFSSVAVSFPGGGSIQSSPVFWRLSTYADPHMFHLALTALIFLLLIVWERQRALQDPDAPGHPDRWLMAAAAVFGVALANHSLTVMLAPGIALFILVVAPSIVLRLRLILACAGLLAATTVGFWLELPIRAAMHAPLVYAHPDSWNGFLYVVTGQQFGGIPASIGQELGTKATEVMNLLTGWLGPLGFVALFGVASSIIRRPSYVLLSLPAAALTSAFAAAYANSDLERYFLVPAFVAFTYVGLGLADAFALVTWLVGLARRRGTPTSAWRGDARLAAELIVLVAVVVSGVSVVTDRDTAPDSTHPGGVDAAGLTYRETWMRAVLAPTDKGGLPANAVIVSNWFDSTSLWYGQKVEGLRPDVHVVDDSMRVTAGDNLGQVWDVIDSYLGQRPVFLLRFPWNCDGMVSLGRFYSLKTYQLPSGVTIPEVTARIGPVVCG